MEFLSFYAYIAKERTEVESKTSKT